MMADCTFDDALLNQTLPGRWGLASLLRTRTQSSWMPIGVMKNRSCLALSGYKNGGGSPMHGLIGVSMIPGLDAGFPACGCPPCIHSWPKAGLRR